ncbi:MAG: WXG100 family type VII secretion target [Acetatifactor sp.]|nr:WXG100 family type VII secretion target [Acetatifactor sp.]
MASIKVTSMDLRNTASTLREYNTNFKTQVAALESSEAALSGQWQGDANTAFHKAFLNDKAFMDKFAVEIEKYCAVLETAAAKYDAQEAANVELANQRN